MNAPLFRIPTKNSGAIASDPALVSLATNGTEFQTKQLPAVDPGAETILESILVSFVFMKGRKPKTEKITENESQTP